MRLVVDSNVWVSALINPDGVPGQLVTTILHNAEVTVVMNHDLAEEVVEVLQRPKFSGLGLDSEWIKSVIGTFELIEANSIPVSPVRDEDDEPVISAAVRGSADAIVSGDKDFTDDPELRLWLSQRAIAVYSPSEALELMRRLA